MTARSGTGRFPADYGFHGSKLIHTLGLAGILLLAAAAYVFWDEALTAPWLIAAAIVGLHLGAWMLLGAGALYWLLRVGRFLMRDRLMAQIPWRGDEQVLDVGCGAGIMLIAAAKRLPGGRAVGIDNWVKVHGEVSTAETVRANAEAEGVGERVEARDGDACNMDFAEATFDVVMCSFVLHHIEKSGRSAAAREMVRVLKPGGRLVVLDVQYIGEIRDELIAAGTVEVKWPRVFRLAPIPRWVTARKPDDKVATAVQ